jgi:hypothetical protein
MNDTMLLPVIPGLKSISCSEADEEEDRMTTKRENRSATPGHSTRAVLGSENGIFEEQHDDFFR